MEDCIFCQIVRGQVPTNFVYEDEKVAVFPDINPAAPVHLLFVPKEHIGDLSDAPDEMVLAIRNRIIAEVNRLGLVDKGYRIIVNGGTAKAVPHLHFHLLGQVKKERQV